MNEDNDELPLSTFFELNGAIGLIALIDREHGNIKKELDSKAGHTGKPVRKLIKAAIEADLIERVPIRPGDHGRSTPYQLTKRGKAVQSLLRGMGLDETQREYLERKQELEAAVSDVQELIEAEGLHKKRIQQDFWTRSDFDRGELERKQAIADQDEEDQEGKSPSPRDDGPGEAIPPEVLPEETDLDGIKDEEERGETEVWGKDSEEDTSDKTDE
ncbi:hypothetical protein U4E84_09275 [Halorubrum sp. AD140]|uniref:hypothetical protein n=1 Tax=Halorubrum sp. AD140 TaxID=3050073 RepID=UPI002ACD0B1F|nr:hypothetical protein [Halorubrum sp. AD140]MDZ5811534.1 hypothetical protein [Halorubrum sp. AD140]